MTDRYPPLTPDEREFLARLAYREAVNNARGGSIASGSATAAHSSALHPSVSTPTSISSVATTCACSSEECRKNGCVSLRGAAAVTQAKGAHL